MAIPSLNILTKCCDHIYIPSKRFLSSFITVPTKSFKNKCNPYLLKNNTKNGLTLCRSSLHTGNVSGLDDFFDSEEHLKQVGTVVQSGRPWRIDELRLKSSDDLHKLWYVLVKEKNMLMTIHWYYSRNSLRATPGIDRFDKVQTSMKNILTVIQERDAAIGLLERGENPSQRYAFAFNILGFRYLRRLRPHVLPPHMNARWRKERFYYGGYMKHYIRLRVERSYKKNYKSYVEYTRKRRGKVAECPSLYSE